MRSSRLTEMAVLENVQELLLNVVRKTIQNKSAMSIIGHGGLLAD